jgi:hypothetical protein
MTQDRTFAANEHCSQPAPFVGDFGPSHRKDAPTHRVKKALLDAVRDGMSTESESFKLIPRHKPVLTTNQHPSFP